MELVNKADELNVLVKLPIGLIVAASYDRLPMVKPEDWDICLSAKRQCLDWKTLLLGILGTYLAR